MAETMWDVLNRVRSKNGPKNQPVNVVVLQPPGQAMRQARQQVYTGAGPDGIVQPGNPVAMVPGFRGMNVLHEGENASLDGNRVQVTPASQVQQPAVNTLPQPTAAQQQNMQQAQNAPGMKGFALGGSFGIPDLGKYVQDSINKAGQAVQQKAQPATTAPQTTTTNPLGVPDIGKGVQNALGGAYDAIKNKLDQSGYTAAQNNATLQVNAGMPTLENKEALQPTRTVYGEAFQAPQVVAPTLTTLPDPQTTQGAQTTPPAQSAYQQGAEEGFAKIRDVARGQSEVNDLARDRALNYFDANAASNDAATIQRLRSEGWSDNDIQAYMLQQNRSTGVQRGGIVTDLAIDERTRAEGAARDLTTLGRSAYESDRSFDYNKAIDEAKTAMAAGDFASAAAAYGKAFPGLQLDLSRLQTAQQLDDFNIGLENLQGFAAAGYEFDKIPPAKLQQLATAMGTTVEGLKGMYGNLTTNAIDKQLNELTSSAIFKSLPPEQQEKAMQMWRTQVLGDIDGWSQDDKGVWRYTPTATAAGSTATKTQTSKSGSTTVTNADGTLTVTPPKEGVGSQPGEYFVSGDGNIYVNKGEGRDPEPIQLDFEMINAADFEPFGETALKVAALRDSDNPYYKAVVTRQAQALKEKQMSELQMKDLIASGAFAGDSLLLQSATPEKSYGAQNPPAMNVRKRKGGGNDYWQIDGWGEGNKIIEINGSKYYIGPRSNINSAGADHSTYEIRSLTDPTDTFTWDSRDYGAKGLNFKNVVNRIMQTVAPGVGHAQAGVLNATAGNILESRSEQKLFDIFSVK